MKAVCHCLQFCWENNEAPWLKRVPLIGRTLRPAIDAYIKASNGLNTGTILNPTTDKSTLPMGSFLPLVPNATIQYRCGDNIGFGKSKYGLLPFSAYKSHRLPRDIAKYIYIIADSPNRSAAHVYSGRCETILQRLFAYLVKEVCVFSVALLSCILVRSHLIPLRCLLFNSIQARLSFSSAEVTYF